MSVRTCESLAAVYTIKNGQPNRSAMKRHQSGGAAYVITVSLYQVSKLAYSGYHRY